MTGDARELKLNDVNFTTGRLTIKSLRKLTQAEREDINSQGVGNHNLWPYGVNFDEDIIWSNTSKLKRLRIHRNTYNSQNGDRNNNDVFYYFMFYLNRDVIMHFRSFWQHDNNGIAYVFGLSGAGNQNIIIAAEKARGDALGYTQPEDLIQENKKYVDQGIKKEHRNLPSHQQLQAQYEALKKENQQLKDRVNELENEGPAFGEEPQMEAKVLQTDFVPFGRK